MRSFIELCVKGHRRVFLDTASIAGLVTSPNQKKGDMATAEAPITVILRNAEPIEVIGIEPVMLFAQVCTVLEKMEDLKGKENVPPIVIQWLDGVDDD